MFNNVLFNDNQVETKEPQLGETEAKKLKQTATAFGFGQESQKHQLEVQQATDGFRKLYVGALGPNTTERSLEQYFAQYGTVLVTQVWNHFSRSDPILLPFVFSGSS